MNIEDPNDSTGKLLRLRSKCTKTLANKVNIPKFIAFIHKSNKTLEGETLKDVICRNNKKNQPNKRCARRIQRELENIT